MVNTVKLWDAWRSNPIIGITGIYEMRRSATNSILMVIEFSIGTIIEVIQNDLYGGNIE